MIAEAGRVVCGLRSRGPVRLTPASEVVGLMPTESGARFAHLTDLAVSSAKIGRNRGRDDVFALDLAPASAHPQS